MPAGDRPPPQRVAAVRLRGAGGPVESRVDWPAAAPGVPGLLVLFSGPGGGGGDALGAGLAARLGWAVLSVAPAAVDEAAATLEWAADHAAELGADPRRLAVTGVGAGIDLATAVAIRARRRGWPTLAPDPSAPVTAERSDVRGSGASPPD